MATQKKVTVNGRPYDMDKLEDVASLQALLVPANFGAPKKDGVRLFLSLQNMTAVEWKRHLAHNFSKILATAQDQRDDNEPAVVSVAFSCEINLTALTVAAIGKPQMSFSRKFKTQGKPKTHDINQGEFLDDDLTVVLDVGALDKEMAPEPKVEKPRKELKVKKTKVAKPAGDDKK